MPTGVDDDERVHPRAQNPFDWSKSQSCTDSHSLLFDDGGVHGLMNLVR
jgi:hypothetical protein